MQGFDLSAGIRNVLEQRASRQAIEFREKWYTWRDLSDYAEGAAALLRAGGLPAGAPIALVARNRLPHAAVIIGALAEKQPLSMIYAFQSPQAIATDIRKMRPHAVVADVEDWTAPVVEAAREVGAIGIAIDLQAPTVRAVAGLERLGAGPHREIPANAGLELLSSGTTGAPKRVFIPMTALVRSVVSATLGAAPDLEAPTAYNVLFWPFGNISVCSLIAQAYLGQPAVLLEKFTVEGLVRAIKMYQIPVLGCPPPVFRQLLEAKVPREDLASVKMAFGGSAALEPETQERFEATYGIPIMWGYGATEFAGTVVTWTPPLRQQFGNNKRGSIGRALPGSSVRVVDPETGTEVPRGVQGFLEAKVDILGPDWIRTTDLATMDDDDFVFLHGRGDGAIVRGGFKIIPERVIDVLRQHPGVRDATVVGLPDPILGQVPAAAIEPRPQAVPTAAELEAHIRAHLPAHHVPVRFLFVDELPRTPSLKVSLVKVKELFAA